MSFKKASLLILIILIVDQTSKYYVKTHFALGDDIHVFNWFKILFVENNGMAWGTKISDFTDLISERTAKVALTLFRVIAIFGIGYWLVNTIRTKGPKLLIICIALIFAGAMGNIIDSIFYGMIFNDSIGQIAQLFPPEGGYDTYLHGNVVDMLYFPIWKGFLPEWIPFVGGDYFTFFEPVFNVADMAISTGFIMLIVFNRKVFPKN